MKEGRHWEIESIKEKPCLFVMSEIMIGKKTEDIVNSLLNIGFEKSQAESFIVESETKLSNPDFRKSFEEYNNKVKTLDVMKDYSFKVLGYDENNESDFAKSEDTPPKKQSIVEMVKVGNVNENLDEYKEFNLMSREDKIKFLIIRIINETTNVLNNLEQSDLRRKSFLSNILFINQTLGWTYEQNKFLLSEFKIDRATINEILSKIIVNGKKIESGIEGSTIQITKSLVEFQLREGLLKDTIVKRLVNSGWEEEIAWYFVCAIEIKPLLDEMYEEYLKKIDSIMYYGERIISPDTIQWNDLSKVQQRKMDSRLQCFAAWRNFPQSLGVLVFCILTPSTNLVFSGLISLLLVLITSILFTLWFSDAIFLIFRKLLNIVVFLGLINLATQVENNFSSIMLTSVLLISVVFLGKAINAVIKKSIWTIYAKKY